MPLWAIIVLAILGLIALLYILGKLGLLSAVASMFEGIADVAGDIDFNIGD